MDTLTAMWLLFVADIDEAIDYSEDEMEVK